MRKWLYAAALVFVPGVLTAAAIGAVVAVPVWVWRRYKTKNTVTVIKPPTMPVLKIVNGGKA